MNDLLRPGRRSIARGAAWTVPVAAVAAAAPAFAASPCNCTEFFVPQFPSTGTSGNDWTVSTVSGTQNGGGTNQFVSGNAFDAPGDPAAGTTLVVQAARSICVTSGRTYRFSYTYSTYNQNAWPQTSELRINNTVVNGSTVVASKPASTSNPTSPVTVAWTSNVTGNVSMAFVHTTVSGGAGTGNEVKITLLAGSSCS